MDFERPVDRLLPRHSLGERRPQLAWNVRAANKLLRRAEQSVAGVIIDLSLDGALIEVPDDQDHAIDDVVLVRFGGVDGQVVVRHRQEAENGSVRYGIQWIGSGAMQQVVEKAVELVRGHSGELRARWEDVRH